jgi:hypothetical protein
LASLPSRGGDLNDLDEWLDAICANASRLRFWLTQEPLRAFSADHLDSIAQVFVTDERCFAMTHVWAARWLS